MLLLLSALASSWLYRWGGSSKDEIPFSNSQWRDTGIPVLLFLYLTFTVGVTWYLSLITSCAVLGLIRTYWDFVNGKDNLFLHGFGIGICFVPLYWDGVSPMGIFCYTLYLSLTMGLVNILCNKTGVKYSVWMEEFYRGAAIFAALPILFFI